MSKKAIKVISFIAVIFGTVYGVKSLLSLDIGGLLVGAVIFLISLVIFSFALATSSTNAEEKIQKKGSNELNNDTPKKYLSTKNLSLVKSETGLTNIRVFKLAGVTFDNRQHNLQLIEQCQNHGGQIKIALNKYIYDGDYAVAVTANGLELGNIKAENLDFVLNNLYRICGYKKLYINNFTNENGNIVWYAEIKLVLVNKKEAKEYEM
jgi:archaellum component FlaF (FlaF/FlaG flagellin family)